MKEKKCIAEFIKWNGEIVTQEIKRGWAESIASAVEGQYMFIDNVSKFAINGTQFFHVDIYEVSA